jgi:rubredoxin
VIAGCYQIQKQDFYLKKINMENEENKTQANLEFEQCTLCSDESCIGVIGPDGRCKECGLPYTGGSSENIEQTPAESDFEDVAENEDVDEDMEEFSEDGDEETPMDLEWEQRTLCSDESCIGVIGPDGRCKECGLPYTGGSSENIEQTPAESDFEDVAEDEDADENEDVAEDEDVDEDMEEFSEDGDEETPTDFEWEQRTLCSDESCIGVIGPDGRCKECGKPYDSK